MGGRGFRFEVLNPGFDIVILECDIGFSVNLE